MNEFRSPAQERATRTTLPSTQPSSNDNSLDRKTEIEGLYRISKILDCGLEKQAIPILMDLLDCGIDPESLADVLLELKSYSQQQKP